MSIEKWQMEASGLSHTVMEELPFTGLQQREKRGRQIQEASPPHVQETGSSVTSSLSRVSSDFKHSGQSILFGSHQKCYVVKIQQPLKMQWGKCCGSDLKKNYDPWQLLKLYNYDTDMRASHPYSLKSIFSPNPLATGQVLWGWDRHCLCLKPHTLTSAADRTLVWMDQ